MTATSREWVRRFINDECIWRSSNEEPTIPGKAKGVHYGWQFYLRRALYDANCSYLIAELFWEKYSAQAGDFQLAACEAAGVPLACAIQAYAKFKLRKNVPVFSIKKEPKKYGLHNVSEGVIVPEMPAMIVDDLAGSQATFFNAKHLLEATSIPIFPDYFAVVNKTGNGVTPHQVYLHDMNLHTLFTCDDFNLGGVDYFNATGMMPAWTGRTLRIRPDTTH